MLKRDLFYEKRDDIKKIGALIKKRGKNIWDFGLYKDIIKGFYSL